ncbi:MAG: molecular chaperone HtpG [Planctomycetota bacterium]|nr:molecular chaperone HtpG [Planctomycetota bacterium]MCX8040187.1 molecular chaperone HtpG [Planctomycetota bacterium]MDW8372518.1 molecular chaperone HtpG [Planctomycetota bacterium]
MATHQFQTEVQQLLHLVIHSLYSDRAIFLRELISNASDACDRLRFLSLTEPQLSAGDSDYRIEVVADREARTLTIRDNGIGMSEAEAIEHLGTIAKSGTKAFLASLAEDARKQAQLIGQFGVGFYSAFMVAERVVVESRSARLGSDEGVRWESRGDGSFTTERIARAARGTSVILHLKDDAEEFLDEARLRELIVRWSDYVPYPIRMPKGGKGGEWEQVNSGVPLWTKPKETISEDDYRKFYHSACRLYDTPATRIHATVEGRLSYTTLLFIPSEKPLDLFDRERRGVALYVRRVFITDDCRTLLPEWLRFVRGIVDSDDLPLNVSRELVQQQAVVEQLRKQLTKRILDHLLKLAQSSEETERQAWQKIDAAFGMVLREGIVTDPEQRDRLARLARWRSTWTEAEAGRPPTGLEDYIRRAPERQREIYYVLAPSLEAARANPAIEGFVKAGREVLFLVDPVDEFVVQHLSEFDGRRLVNAAHGAADLLEGEGKRALEQKAKELAPFLSFAKERLGDVSEVRLSARLADSPACIVSEGYAISPQMEAMLKRLGQPVPAQQRVLELNPEHPLVQQLAALHAQRHEQQAVEILAALRDTALLAAGLPVPDPAAAARRLQALLTPRAAQAAAGESPGAAGERPSLDATLSK